MEKILVCFNTYARNKRKTIHKGKNSCWRENTIPQEKLHRVLIPLYLLPSFYYCYPKCMYVCILQRKQVFYFLYFAWHLHWTRPCHWFLIWELNTNPQLSILANVISCWINKQCFCGGEGWITGAVSYNSFKLDCSTERKSVCWIYEQKKVYRIS